MTVRDHRIRLAVGAAVDTRIAYAQHAKTPGAGVRRGRDRRATYIMRTARITVTVSRIATVEG